MTVVFNQTLIPPVLYFQQRYAKPDHSQAEVSIHIGCNEFTQKKLRDLIPDWPATPSPISTLLILQKSPVPLNEAGETTEQEKNRLRDELIFLLFPVVERLRRSGYYANFFDPRSGEPFFGKRGADKHSDVHQAKALLNYDIVTNAACCAKLKHPVWDINVYPATLLSNASAKELLTVFRRVASWKGWKRSVSLN